jgi:hypothetical protein
VTRIEDSSTLMFFREPEVLEAWAAAARAA